MLETIYSDMFIVVFHEQTYLFFLRRIIITNFKEMFLFSYFTLSFLFALTSLTSILISCSFSVSFPNNIVKSSNHMTFLWLSLLDGSLCTQILEHCYHNHGQIMSYVVSIIYLLNEYSTSSWIPRFHRLPCHNSS